MQEVLGTGQAESVTAQKAVQEAEVAEGERRLAPLQVEASMR